MEEEHLNPAVPCCKRIDSQSSSENMAGLLSCELIKSQIFTGRKCDSFSAEYLRNVSSSFSAWLLLLLKLRFSTLSTKKVHWKKKILNFAMKVVLSNSTPEEIIALSLMPGGFLATKGEKLRKRNRKEIRIEKKENRNRRK